MGESLHLGRIAGVEIGLHWTVAFTAALIGWTLGANVFPSSNPGLGTGAYVVMAAAATLLFLATLVLHELGHAVQARREGVTIEGITLWLFGGVARLRGTMPSAGAELRIALAGPAVTLVLSAAFLAIAVAAPFPETVDGVATWLGYINASLLIFNVLPAFPLDGGRVLRAALWMRTDVATATRRTLRVARVLSTSMIAWGVLIVLAGGLVSGIWLALIGWFLVTSSRAEEQAVGVRERLGDLVVADVMERSPIVVPPDLTLDRFVDETAWRSRHPTYPVIRDGRPVGLLPFHAIARIRREEWPNFRVQDCMLPLAAVPVLDADTPAYEALERLSAAPMRRALVITGDRLAGLVTLTDLTRAVEAPPHRHAHGARDAA